MPVLLLRGLALFAAPMAIASWLDVAQGGPCQESTVELDSTHADTTLLQFFGRAVGQVFDAPDTIIKAISVWRAPLQHPYYPYLILYVTGTDSSGVPDYVNVLREGPVVLPPQQDDGIHPVRIDFVLDPPLPLQRRGLYFMAIKDFYCDDAIELLADATNGYPQGRAWKTSPVFDCSTVGDPRELSPALDLVFRVVFCSDTTTAARRTSWGQLKQRYR